uniref:TSC22 domain family protein 3 n=1 Tax=Bos mutus grunniens TaxID=30521 RepID=A0A8B9Y6X0_BOSMU
MKGEETDRNRRAVERTSEFCYMRVSVSPRRAQRPRTPSRGHALSAPHPTPTPLLEGGVSPVGGPVRGGTRHIGPPVELETGGGAAALRDSWPKMRQKQQDSPSQSAAGLTEGGRAGPGSQEDGRSLSVPDTLESPPAGPAGAHLPAAPDLAGQAAPEPENMAQPKSDCRSPVGLDCCNCCLDLAHRSGLQRDNGGDNNNSGSPTVSNFRQLQEKLVFENLNTDKLNSIMRQDSLEPVLRDPCYLINEGICNRNIDQTMLSILLFFHSASGASVVAIDNKIEQAMCSLGSGPAAGPYVEMEIEQTTTSQRSSEESSDVCCERGGGDPEGADPGAGGEELPAGAGEYSLEDPGEPRAAGEVPVPSEPRGASSRNPRNPRGPRWFCGLQPDNNCPMKKPIVV